MRRRGATAHLLAATLAAGGCAGGAEPAGDMRRVPGAVTVIGQGSAEAELLLAMPVDLAVDARGAVYVLDQMLGHVVRVDLSGETEVLGRPGAGPGELRMPMTLSVVGDSIRVDDRGNRRVQVLSAAGRHVRSYPVRVRSSAAAAFGPRGELIFETEGAGGRLAAILDSEGAARGSVGEAPAPAAARWDFREIKAEIGRGRVPGVLRNAVRPAMGTDGAAWLVLAAEGTVLRYGGDGSRRSTPLDAPEVDAIRAQFFTRNRAERSPFAYYPLSYAADAVSDGGEFFVLLQRPESEPAVVLTYGRDGRLARHWTFPEVRGARRLALDRTRGRIYFAVPESATVVGVDVSAHL